MKPILMACLVTFCLGGVAVKAVAQDAVKDAAKQAGEATKEGAKKTGEAAKEGTKKTAQATTAGTKKAAEATASGTKKTAEATTAGTKKATKATTHATADAGNGVKNVFTGDVTVTCNDGKKHSGKTNTAACADHGGVKK